MPGIDRPMSGRRHTNNGGLSVDNAHSYRLTVGRWVAEHREKAGLTQRELAKLLGVEGTFISSIECGRNPLPPERYKEFVETLNIAPRVAGKFLLEFTNPWLFALIYGEDKLGPAHHLDEIPERIMDHRRDEG